MPAAMSLLDVFMSGPRRAAAAFSCQRVTCHAAATCRYYDFSCLPLRYAVFAMFTPAMPRLLTHMFDCSMLSMLRY